jgi:ABC-type dipeptide/oligopeptide/nickel transport system ATPase component
MSNERLLEVSGLRIGFGAGAQRTVPIKDISFHINAGETFALVGESGCGKSTLALSLLRLLSDSGRIESGEIRFMGRDMLKILEKELRDLRGRDIAMVFQDPMSAFHPLMTIGGQLMEAVKGGTRSSKKQKALEMLQFVGLPNPEKQMRSHSFELSGGMLQRAMIAMALINRPKLLIADEPTTALDMSVQAHILKLLKRSSSQLGMGMLFISHDLGVVAELADRVAVMHQGRIVEYGEVKRVFRQPEHPYTRHLLAMAPILGQPLLRREQTVREYVEIG